MRHRSTSPATSSWAANRSAHPRAAAARPGADARGGTARIWRPSTSTSPIWRHWWASCPAGSGRSIAIGRAAAFAPKVLIMDEPTSALAVAEVEAVLRLIRRLSRSAASGVILITHRLQDLFLVCDRIAVMYEGRRLPSAGSPRPTSRISSSLIVGEQGRAAASGAGTEPVQPSAARSGRALAPISCWRTRAGAAASPPSSSLVLHRVRARHRRLPHRRSTSSTSCASPRRC